MAARENNDLALKHGFTKVLVTFAKGRWVQAPKELISSVLKTLVEFFRRGVPTRRQGVLNAPRRMTESMLEALDSHARSWSKEPGDLIGGSLRGEGAGTLREGEDLQVMGCFFSHKQTRKKD